MGSYVRSLMARLFGPSGERVATTDLTGESLPADGFFHTVRSQIRPTEGLTPQRLAQVMHRAELGDPRGYLEAAEEAEEKDGHFAAVLSTRKRAVMQLPITVEAASDTPAAEQHAELVRDWLSIGCLQGALLDILDAVSKSYSVLEIDWQTDRDHFWPKRLIHKPPTWFRPDPVDGETIRIRDGAADRELPAHKFIVHTHRYKSGSLIRSGLGRVALWSWMAKMFTDRDWQVFIQNYGQPMRVGKYGQSSSEKDRNILWQAVRDIAGDMAAIFPESMKVEFIEPRSAASSADLFEKRAKYVDYQISKIVLGQTTTTDAVAGGHAVAQEHRLVQQDIERSDAGTVANTINTQLIPLLVSFNFGPQDEYPTISIGRPDETPIKDIADAVEKMGPLGLTLPVLEVRNRLGFRAPMEGEEVIGGRSAPVGPSALAKALQSRSHRRTTDEEMVARLTDRLGRDAAGALHGMTKEVRSALEEASSLPDALLRLERLQLNSRDLAEAMRRGMALAHLSGQAALIDDLDGEV